MIERYSYPEMRAIWEPANKFAKWLEVELLVAEGWAEIGEIPREAAQALRANARFEVDRILELEGELPGRQVEGATYHDLIAFLKATSEHLGDEARYLHFGVTSYDIEDTALALLLRESCDLIAQDIRGLNEAIRARAREHKWTVMPGRTHGVQAEPITLGHKLAVWLAEMQRNLERLSQAREMVSVGKISGAVGTYANVDPRVEEYVCARLGLQTSPASTQILQRDRHAHYLTTLAILAGSLEQFATEVRNLQRTEILELEEPFRQGQRGSSAMPHKRNPMTCERITSLARVARALCLPALEAIATWHERDLTTSAAERITLPDASILIDYMLRRFSGVVAGMVVYPENMKRNLERLGGLTSSEQVMLALVRKGMDKDQAYRLVQQHAMAAWEQGKGFRAGLAADPQVTGLLSPAELEACFDHAYHLRHLERVYERMGI